MGGHANRQCPGRSPRDRPVESAADGGPVRPMREGVVPRWYVPIALIIQGRAGDLDDPCRRWPELTPTTAVPPLTCPACGRDAATRRSLGQHRRRAHGWVQSVAERREADHRRHAKPRTTTAWQAPVIGLTTFSDR